MSRHVHTGDATSGGGCYGAANYHVHSGDSVNGGGCYGTPVYHVHEGQANQTVANGCYTVQSAGSGTCTIRVTGPGNGSSAGDNCFCHNCPGGQPSTNYGWAVTHSSCGRGTDFGSHGYRQCNTCGAVTYEWGSGRNSPMGTHWIPSGTHQYNITVYAPGCGKTEQSVEYYELNCGKTTTTVESYSMNCGKSADTAEGYTLNCGKTPDTVESYSLNCEYQNDTKIRTLICTLGGNAYADSKEIGTERKHKKDCYQEYMWGMKKSREIRQLQPLCFKGI